MRRTIAALAAAAVVTSAAVAAGPAVSQTSPSAWAAPRAERIISGASRPGVAAWGLAYNQVTDEVIVGDYVAKQVRRFTRNGRYLGDFANPTGTTDGVPSAVAVDPRDGSVYLAITGTTRTFRQVRKYDARGNFLFDLDITRTATWLAVDAEGDLWIPEPFGGARINQWRVDSVSKTATAITTIDNPGTGPGQTNRLTGVAVDAVGSIYVADVGNGVVHKYDASGRWIRDFGSKALFKGDMRGVAVDQATNRVYVANSHVGTIEVFSTDGAHLDTVSGPGDGNDQFVDGARQLAVTPDGHLLAADYGSRRVIDFTAAGGYVSHFPNPAMPADAAGVDGPRGVSVDPGTGDVLVADSWNQRVLRFAPDGTPLQVHGRRGSTIPLGMNYPRSIGVDPVTRNVWVPNYEGAPHLVVYAPDFGSVVQRIVTPRFVNDIEFVGDLVYLVVRSKGHVQVHNRVTGELVRTCCTGLGMLRGIAVDRATGNLWLTSDVKPEMYVLSSTGTRIATIPVDGRGWGVAIVGDVVYMADTVANKVAAFDRRTYARLGSFGTEGTGFGQLRGPSGLIADATGRLYVTEERNARVQVFSLAARPAVETTAPTASYTTSSQTSGTPLAVAGTAADASGVALVEVQVKDNATGTYWNARTSVWGRANWSPAISWGPRTSSTWRFTLVNAIAGGSYTMRTRVTDVHGNVSAPLVRTFTVS